MIVTFKILLFFSSLQNQIFATPIMKTNHVQCSGSCLTREAPFNPLLPPSAQVGYVAPRMERDNQEYRPLNDHMIPSTYETEEEGLRRRRLGQLDPSPSATSQDIEAPEPIREGFPTPVQSKAISRAKVEQIMSQDYYVNEHGVLFIKPKEGCDCSHYCGKMIFYDLHSRVKLAETGCCFWNKSFFSYKETTSGENLISSVICSCCTTCLGRCYHECCDTR